MRIRMTADLHVEAIDDEVLVADPLTDTVVRLSGDSAGVVQTLLADGETDVAEGDVLNGLLAHGVVEPAEAGSFSMSRRQLIGTAAAVTGIGIAAMAMPTPAAAASPGPTPPPPGPEPALPPDMTVATTGLLNRFSLVWTDANTVTFNWAVVAPFPPGVVTQSGSATTATGLITVPNWTAGTTLSVQVTATGVPANYTASYTVTGTRQ